MKKLLIFLLGLSGFGLFSVETAAQQFPGNSLADQFALQAGTIAGTVQACGQNIMEYGSRVVEAVNLWASTPQERMQAMTIYQRALANAQTAQSRTHSVNCAETVRNFNALPLMRPDYKKTVLPQLAQMKTQAATALSTPPVTLTPPPAPSLNAPASPPASQ